MDSKKINEFICNEKNRSPDYLLDNYFFAKYMFLISSIWLIFFFRIR